MPSYYSLKVVLNQILDKINSLDSKLDLLSSRIFSCIPERSEIVPQTVLVNSSLMKTLEVLKSSKKYMTAVEVSNVTQRARAMESSYLNQLYRMGLVEKKRVKRNTIFKIKEGVNVEQEM